MLVLVTTEIKKIHGLYHWKDGMEYFKTHVELMLKNAQNKRYKNDKSPSSDKYQRLTATSPLPTKIWASR